MGNFNESVDLRVCFQEFRREPRSGVLDRLQDYGG
jgi:hypothetical protein